LSVERFFSSHGVFLIYLFPSFPCPLPPPWLKPIVVPFLFFSERNTYFLNGRNGFSPRGDPPFGGFRPSFGLLVFFLFPPFQGTLCLCLVLLKTLPSVFFPHITQFFFSFRFVETPPPPSLSQTQTLHFSRFVVVFSPWQPLDPAFPCDVGLWTHPCSDHALSPPSDHIPTPRNHKFLFFVLCFASPPRGK